MKSFSRFLSESVTQAARQAKRLGLNGDGHGGWVDPNGKVVARTVDGKLVFTSGRRPSAGTDPDKPGAAARQALPDEPPAGNDQGAQQAAPEAEPEQEVEKTRGVVTLGFGRFNPPTAGHAKLLDTIADTADGEQYYVYPSHSQDAKKNPLDSQTKVEFMKQLFPDHANNIVFDASIKTILDALKQADVEGFASVNIVVGADRQKEFETLANKYNGQLYNFDEINVISAGERDPDAEGVEGMSASKLRKLAIDGDAEGFAAGLPPGTKPKLAQQLFNTVRKSMSVKAETWEIAPKFDWKSLRENYINEKVFNVGTLVESLNTGLIGRVIRKGANHIIAVTKEGLMFKSWIRDITETFTDRAGVPASQRGVGTDSYRKYVEKLTPNDKVKSLINKNIYKTGSGRNV
jgi:phosphopantetheine adenylyltransferase